MSIETFEQKIKAHLDNGLSNLDANTQKRLASIRKQALAERKQPAKWLTTQYWFGFIPATSLALCTLFAIFLIINPKHEATLASGHDQLAVFELLNNTDELEVITDPDFYAWMDETLTDETLMNETTSGKT